jgi:hypothetical protein
MTSLHDIEMANLNSGAKTEPVASCASDEPHMFDAGLGISTRVTTRPNPVGTASGEINFGRQDLWLGNSDMTDRDDLGAVPDASMLSLFRGLVTFLMEESRKRGWQDISDSLQQVESAIASRAARKQGPN